MSAAKADTPTPAPQIDYVSEGYASGYKIPWQLKMAIKIALSKIPFSYALWTKLGVFRHGDTSRNLDNLQGAFDRYIDIYKELYSGQTPERILELGPGDSIGHALDAKRHGIEESWLVDVGDFATQDEEHYQAYFEKLNADEHLPAPENFQRDTVLEYCNAHYLTGGLQDLKTVPNETLDLSFSTAVLEHVRRGEFQAHMDELYRAHKPGSFSAHWVDPHDHLGGALNNMRFSPEFWESKTIHKAGFYTNRMTMAEIVECGEKAGFKVEIKRIVKWRALPTPRNEMHSTFREKSEEELNVCTFLMHLTK